MNIKALLGRESIATTRIDADVGQERVERVVGRSRAIPPLRAVLRRPSAAPLAAVVPKPHQP